MAKFLIIDDNEHKYEVIKSALLDLGIRSESIDWAKSKKVALNLMRAERYLVALLDLQLPEYDFDTPKNNGGLELLYKISRNKTRYLIPNYIICLSSYGGIINEQSDDFLILDYSVHSFESNSWRNALKHKIDWAVDVVRSAVAVRHSTELLTITLHGIRTQGRWQELLENSVRESVSEAVFRNYKYNYFSALKLLIPFFRAGVIKKFRSCLVRFLDEHPNAEVVFFAHSFGTYILLKALEELPVDVDVRIKKIVLASSVVKENYDFSKLKRLISECEVVNDCGFNDPVLLLSKHFCLDMGMAGRSGFVGMEVINRYFAGGHDFFYKNESFIRNYWVPVLYGQVKKVDEREFSAMRENLEILVSSRFMLFFILLFAVVVCLMVIS